MLYAGTQKATQDASAQAGGATSAYQQVTQAIRTAAAQTGVSFSYLLNKAEQESGGDPTAKSSTSSATGLFQFTGQTWLRMVKSYGAQYGIGNYAEHIKISSDGSAHVDDPKWKQAVLALRKDPQLSAEMAGELDKENGASLKANVGGKIGATELYLAHFLGAGGASDFIKTMRADPNAKAADVLPEAADANSSVFYDSKGDARSVTQIYQHFAKKFDKNDSNIMMASAVPNTTPTASPATYSRAAATYANYGAHSYVVADTTAAQSSFAAMAGVQDQDTQSASYMAAMLLSQMKINDAATTSSETATSAYNKRNAYTMTGAIT